MAPFTLTTDSPEQTIAFGRFLGERFRGGEVLAIEGTLGTGKTHLIKGEKPAGGFESHDVHGLAIKVDSAEGDKCERCWVHDISVGANLERPTICSRCQDALTRISPD